MKKIIVILMTVAFILHLNSAFAVDTTAPVINKQQRDWHAMDKNEVKNLSWEKARAAKKITEDRKKYLNMNNKIKFVPISNAQRIKSPMTEGTK